MQSVILGTAQWGLDYGVTNTAGRLSDEAVREVADSAWALGIRTLDTAPAYGDAEERIPSLGHGFAVQTKVSIGGGIARIRGVIRAHEPESAGCVRTGGSPRP